MQMQMWLLLVALFLFRASQSACLWQEPAWNVNYIIQLTQSLNGRLERNLSPRNFKRVNKDAKI